MNQDTQLRHFKLPIPHDTFLIALLDTSKSMKQYWPYIVSNYNALKAQLGNCLAITFDSIATYQDNQDLSLELQDHNEANLIDAFSMLDQLCRKYIQPITVLLVSTGQFNLPQHSVHHSAKLMCMAVGDQFPIELANQLYMTYPQGNWKPLYRVQTYSDALKTMEIHEYLQMVFHNEFQLIRNDLKQLETISVPPCFSFPWSTETSINQWAGTWVLSAQEFLNLGGDVKLLPMEINLEELLCLSKYWLQNLQQITLNVAEKAQKAYNELVKLLTQLPKQKKLSFAERIYQKHCMNPIQQVMKEIKILAEFNFLAQLSVEEAAKRVAIGTVTGKYHNNAVKIRGVSINRYTRDRNIFIEIIEKSQLVESDSERSIISFQNQKEIIMEPDFIDGLIACPSQYELVTTLPLIGYAVYVRRTDSSRINPWLTQVFSMAKHHKYLDTITIQGAKGHVLKLSVGDGDLEKVNCVLPLYTQKDKDLYKILQSNLFHMLMTFNVMENVDTCFDTAYAALMANCLLYLINQPESGWKSDLIKLIEETYQLTYQRKYKGFAQSLQNTPNLALVTNHPDLKTKCEDPSKAILVLQMIKHQLPQEQIKVITERIIIEAIARLMPPQIPIQDYFTIKLIDNKDDNQINSILSQYPDNLVGLYYTEQELKEDLMKKILSSNQIKQADNIVELNIQKLNKVVSGYKFSLQNLQRIYAHFNDGRSFGTEFLIIALNHSQIRNSYQRGLTPITEDVGEILARLYLKLSQAEQSAHQIFEFCYRILGDKYFHQMFQLHCSVIPMRQADIQQYCINDNIANNFKFNKVSNLLVNACLAPECPHFMKLSTNLSGHIQVILQMNQFTNYNVQVYQQLSILAPAFHKTIKTYIDRDDEQILEYILQGKCLIRSGRRTPQFNQRVAIICLDSKQHILGIINNLKVAYTKFQL